MFSQHVQMEGLEDRLFLSTTTTTPKATPTAKTATAATTVSLNNTTKTSAATPTVQVAASKDPLINKTPPANVTKSNVPDTSHKLDPEPLTNTGSTTTNPLAETPPTINADHKPLVDDLPGGDLLQGDAARGLRQQLEAEMRAAAQEFIDAVRAGLEAKGLPGNLVNQYGIAKESSAILAALTAQYAVTDNGLARFSPAFSSNQSLLQRDQSRYADGDASTDESNQSQDDTASTGSNQSGSGALSAVGNFLLSVACNLLPLGASEACSIGTSTMDEESARNTANGLIGLMTQGNGGTLNGNENQQLQQLERPANGGYDDADRKGSSANAGVDLVALRQQMHARFTNPSDPTFGSIARDYQRLAAKEVARIMSKVNPKDGDMGSGASSASGPIVHKDNGLTNPTGPVVPTRTNPVRPAKPEPIPAASPNGGAAGAVFSDVPIRG